MMLGVKTIGNATLIAFDDEPLLATDPWFENTGAYFGSWSQSHPVPMAEREEILKSKYVWISHGHPDHLDWNSITQLRGQTILLPDHYGNRIYRDLDGEGFPVRILPDRRWVQLSRRIRVMCISDYYQDAVLLVDVGGRLFINLNDARDLGWGKFVRSVAATYSDRYLLKLAGYGDADMINFYNENDGRFIEPAAAQKRPVGAQIAAYLRLFNCNHFIPFSSFHRYQRSDSAWANAYTTPLSAYAESFDHSIAELHPAFVSIDATTGQISPIDPAPAEETAIACEVFGDHWSESLERGDLEVIRSYFHKREHVWKKFGWLNFRVGSCDNRFDMAGPRHRGITFEVPRNSLMIAINHEIFDDLLIGNFMRTTLHGGARMYPEFTPYVAKYGDNGRAYSKSELAAYMASYRRRDPIEFFKNALEIRSEQFVRKIIGPGSPGFKLAKKIYVAVKSA